MTDFGRQLLLGFDGTSPQDDQVKRVQQLLKDQLIGGVILFQKNIICPAQVLDLSQSLREAAPRQALIAVDQEGGRVQRFNACNGFVDFPSAAQMASHHTPLAAQQIYEQMAKILASSGVNLNFGPVVDLATSPVSGISCPVIGGLERSYGSTSAHILPYAQAFINAHRRYNIKTCLKHYPGHGLASLDSHEGCVDITETFEDAEEQPFQALVHTGFAEMIMIAHVHHRQWDDQYPASLSPTILQRLRRYYSGVIVSDDYHMGAIVQHFDVEQTLRQAFKSGVDLLVFSNNPKVVHLPFFENVIDKIEDIHKRVEIMIKDGFLNRSLLKASWARLKSLSEREKGSSNEKLLF